MIVRLVAMCMGFLPPELGVGCRRTCRLSRPGRQSTIAATAEPLAAAPTGHWPRPLPAELKCSQAALRYRLKYVRVQEMTHNAQNYFSHAICAGYSVFSANDKQPQRCLISNKNYLALIYIDNESIFSGLTDQFVDVFEI